MCCDFTRSCDQSKAGVSDKRRAGIRYQGDVLACLEPFDEVGRLALLAVLVETGSSGGKSEALKQMTCVPRVFSGNQRYLSKHSQRPG